MNRALPTVCCMLPVAMVCALLVALAGCGGDASPQARSGQSGLQSGEDADPAANSATDAAPIETASPSTAVSKPSTVTEASAQAPAPTPPPSENSAPVRPVAASRAASRAAAVDPGRTLDKTFDDIKFEMEVGEPFERAMLSDQIEALQGQSIRIRGYIYPTAQKRMSQFVLVRDNMECCFGPGAALYDCILVEMKPGKLAEFSIRPVAVEGKFDIRPFLGPDGTHLAIYHLEAESVE